MGRLFLFQKLYSNIPIAIQIKANIKIHNLKGII